MLQVNLKRQFLFRNSKKSYDGIPVIASNMDTVGTFEMARALEQVSQAAYTVTMVFPVNNKTSILVCSMLSSRAFISTILWLNGSPLLRITHKL